jgi:uncharacterized protein YndB with AHSA1/START domain
MTPSQMNKVERKTIIRAPRSRVWRAITDIREFCQWFSTSSEEPAFRPGAHVRLVSTHPGPYEGKVFFVDIVEMTPEQTFSWKWHPADLDPGVDLSREPMTLVVFRLEDAEGGTLVTVTETGFDKLFPDRIAKVFASNEGGWNYQMGALERYFSGAK